jgi:hypothetical protein
MHRISPGEEQALIALYRRCNGDSWPRRRGWLSDPNPCDWEGVTCEGGRVTRLALPANRLEGTLPSRIDLLAYLEQIDLSGNALSGAIPAEMGNLLRLSVIDLSDNDLSGPLPERLRILRRLRHLDLHSNRLNGRIPPVLRELVSLETLDLSQNRFTGPVPAGLGRLTRLVTLRLDQNELRGPLPMELSALRALSTFTFGQTGLAELPDPAFQSWLSGIDRLNRTHVLHTEVVTHAGGGNLPLAALASMGTFGGVLVGTLLALMPFLGPAAAIVAAFAGAAGAGIAGKRVYELTADRRQSAVAESLPVTTEIPADDAALRAALTREMHNLVRWARAELPHDIVDEVEGIEATLLTILPRVPRLSGGDADTYTVRQTVRDYLPEALAPYRALPRDFAQQQPIQAGKTAHEHLLRQLEVLHQGLQRIAERLPEEDAQRLLVHGRFLESKFRESDPNADLTKGRNT